MDDVVTRFNKGWLFVVGLVLLLAPLVESTFERGNGFLDMRGFIVAVILIFTGVLSLAIVVALVVLRGKRGTSSTWPTAMFSALAVVVIAASAALTESTHAPAAIAASIGAVVALGGFVAARPPRACWWIVLTPIGLMITAALSFLFT